MDRNHWNTIEDHYLGKKATKVKNSQKNISTMHFVEKTHAFSKN